jgi:hypothetical protein
MPHELGTLRALTTLKLWDVHITKEDFFLEKDRGGIGVLSFQLPCFEAFRPQ